MASSLLALLDDISTVLDDVSLLAKAAAQTTSGVIGDDLALNAQQVAGVRAERELPVVFAVAKGSLINKAILVPAALAISAFAPWAVTVLLMVGVHGIAPLRIAVEGMAGGPLVALPLNIAIGMVAGAIVLGAVAATQVVLRKP